MLLGGAGGQGSEGSGRGPSWVLSVASHPTVSDLGRYSFHVYLLQTLVAKPFLWMQAYERHKCASVLACVRMPVPLMAHPDGTMSSDILLLFFAALWTLSVLWVRWVEDPWVTRMKGVTPARHGVERHISK